MSDRLERLVFSARRTLLITFALLTLAAALPLSHLRIDAGFEKRLPLSHPYMQTFIAHQSQFGGANRLLIAVEAKDGDIFQPAILNTIEQVTDAVFFLPGVNKSSVRSIFTPNVRFIQVVEGGLQGGNVVPAGFAATPEDIASVRENVLKAGIVGQLVANDFSAALISADLIERERASGERLDYLEVAETLERTVRAPFENERTRVHIIGFAKAIGDIADGAAGVAAFFGLALLTTALIVWLALRDVRLAALPLGCSIVAVVWTLACLPLLGFGLDPMSILIPFLILAIGVSHGVQMVQGARLEIARGEAPEDAARATFRRLLVPGAVALLSDAIGFLTILLIEIRIIRELALTASLGVGLLIVTNLFLLPLLLSLLRPAAPAPHQRLARLLDAVWRRLALLASPRPAILCLAGASVLLVGGLLQARHLEIGDLDEGVPELRPDSRYNRDARFISRHFDIGVDILQVIVEGPPDGCVDHEVMAAIDRLAWHMRNVQGVRSTLSLPEVAKSINAAFNEGSLKWRVLPRHQASLAQAITPIETSSGLLNADCSLMPVIVFTADHKATTIERVVQAVERHAEQAADTGLEFRLATGNLGVMAASNEVVEAAQVPILLNVYGAVVALCLLTFRSLRATLCIVLPLGLISVLVHALMSLLGIGLKVFTLPVAALGVGIGVDYGIYLFARLRTHLSEGVALPDAYLLTLRSTGRAVLLTGLTLAVGVSSWTFSALQFQADMGLLLAFMFLGNMVAALVLLPALAFVLYRPRRRPA
ncbi:MAG: MMPL family transporter [Geminicoccaceae bacterium]|nr:MMPL family transporter [Geminicoccaceae bacterium]